MKPATDDGVVDDGCDDICVQMFGFSKKKCSLAECHATVNSWLDPSCSSIQIIHSFVMSILLKKHSIWSSKWMWQYHVPLRSGHSGTLHRWRSSLITWMDYGVRVTLFCTLAFCISVVDARWNIYWMIKRQAEFADSSRFRVLGVSTLCIQSGSLVSRPRTSAISAIGTYPWTSL